MFLRAIRNRKRVAALGVSGALALGVAACGDSSTDSGDAGGGDTTQAAAGSGTQAEIENVALKFQKAGLDGDAELVCAQLTRAYVRELEKRAKGESCVASFKPILKQRIKNAPVPKITAVEMVNDDQANVIYRSAGRKGMLKVIKENGQWRVDMGNVQAEIRGGTSPGNVGG